MNKYVKYYKDLCERYNVKPVENIETYPESTILEVYKRTCDYLGVVSTHQPNRMAMTPSQMEVAFKKYVDAMSCNYGVVTGHTKDGDPIYMDKPAILSVAGFKVYLYELYNIQPYTTTSLLSMGDFRGTRALIYSTVENHVWRNAGRGAGEIDVNATKLFFEKRVEGTAIDYESRDKHDDDNDKITPDDYRQSVLEGLASFNEQRGAK